MVRLTLKKYLNEREISRQMLSEMTGIKYDVVDRYYKNQAIRYDSYVLNRICEALKCSIGDIIEYIDDANIPNKSFNLKK